MAALLLVLRLPCRISPVAEASVAQNIVIGGGAGAFPDWMGGSAGRPIEINRAVLPYFHVDATDFWGLCLSDGIMARLKSPCLKCCRAICDPCSYPCTAFCLSPSLWHPTLGTAGFLYAIGTRI